MTTATVNLAKYVSLKEALLGESKSFDLFLLCRALDGNSSLLVGLAMQLLDFKQFLFLPPMYVT